MRILRKIYHDFMVSINRWPYKSVRLDSGIIVDHYRNGKIVAKRGSLKNKGQ
jgi:hypothetical protein